MSWPLIGLPREESRCLLQDLALLTQARVVAPQPAQLLPLITGQPLTLTRIDLRLAQPVTQRLRRDAELARQLRQRQPARARQPNSLGTKLGRIRRSCLRHLDSFLRPEGASIEVSTEPGQPQRLLANLLRCGAGMDHSAFASPDADAIAGAAEGGTPHPRKRNSHRLCYA